MSKAKTITVEQALEVTIALFKEQQKQFQELVHASKLLLLTTDFHVDDVDEHLDLTTRLSAMKLQGVLNKIDNTFKPIDYTLPEGVSHDLL